MDPHFTGVSFANSQMGMYVGWFIITSQLSEFILKTTDSGITWEWNSHKLRFRVYGVCCIDSKNITVMGEEGKIFRSYNGGESWVNETSGTDNALYNAYFTDLNNGTIVGKGGVILHYNPSWDLINSGTINNLRGVGFSDADNAFAVGYSGSMIKTTDRGLSWSSVSQQLNENFEDVQFADKNFGIAITTQNKIYSTTDGGINWNSYSTDGQFNKVSFVDTTNAVIVGNYGLILRTTDRGKTWSKKNSGTSNNLYGVDFINANTGYAVGLYKTILTTTDGGENWRLQYSSSRDFLYDISFTSVNNGTAVGGHGEVLHTTNGGSSWVSQNSGITDEDLFSVTFSDDLNGIAVGSSGTLILTTDGGKNWLKEQTNLDFDLVDVSIKDSVTICVGDYGTILRYNKWVVKIDSTKELPEEFSLQQNYPNPFNPRTTIEYSIPKQSNVTIKVFDLLGREVATLVDEEKAAGNYKVEFNGSNLSSGIYFYRLEAGGFSETKKFLLLK